MKIARAIERLLPLLLFFTTISAAFYWWRTEVRYQSALERIDTLQKERRPTSGAPVHTEPAAPAKMETKIVRVPAEVESPNAIRTIEELRARMTQLSAEVAQAREEAATANAKLAAAATEASKAKEQLAESRAALDHADRLLAAANAEAKVRNERLSKSEAAEKTLTEKLRAAAAKPAPSPAKTASEIERRREALLLSLQRRYREVTDLYRSFTLSAQGRDMGAGDLSRIESSIQQAEDELRQLQALR